MSSDKKYTIEQLRAAWGAGKFSSKKDIPLPQTNVADIELQTVDLLYDGLLRCWFFLKWLNGDYEPSNPMENDIDFIMWLIRPTLLGFERSKLAPQHKERMEKFWHEVLKVMDEDGFGLR